MKKLLGSVLALALVASVSQANAELLKNFKFGGSVEVNAVSARNVRDFETRSYNNSVPADHVGSAQTRIMLNMDWDLLDDVHAKVSLSKNNRVYGANGDNAARNGPENAQTLQTQVYIDQGYFKIDKVFGLLDMTFGRQFYGEPGDLIVYYGPKYDEYGMNVTAIDGARFDWTSEKAYAQVVAFQPRQGAALGATNHVGRQDIRGFIVGNKGDEHIDGKVYLWNSLTHGALDEAATPPGVATKNDNLYILGTKVKGKFGGAYGSAEVAVNFGENRAMVAGAPVSRRYAGKALILNGGLKADVEQIGTFNPWVEFAWGSGNGDFATPYFPTHNMDFQTIASDYRPGAIWGRFSANNAGGVIFGNTPFGGAGGASNGLANRVIYALGVKATPSALNKLTAGLAFYNFRLQNIGGNGSAGSVATGGHRSIGQEYDLTAEWKHSENVSLKGTVGNFQPGDLIRNAFAGAGNSPNSAWLSALDVSVKF